MAMFLGRLVIVFGLVLTLSSAAVKSYEEIVKEPTSIAKDYYIYRLIENKAISKEELGSLKSSVFRLKGRLKTAYDKILPPASVVDNCKGVTTKNIMDANLTCKKSRCFPNFVKFISQKDKEMLAIELNDDSPVCASLLRGYMYDNPAVFFAQNGDLRNFFRFYNSLDTKEISSYFNYEFKSEFLDSIASNSNFSNLVNECVINKTLPNLAYAMTKMSVKNLNAQDAFLLGVNAVAQNEAKEGVKFFKFAALNSSKTFAKDNANFWVYLITKDESLLKSIAQSSDINIYSLYAREILNQDIPSFKVLVPKTKSVQGYDESDPFAWQRLKIKADNATKEELLKLANGYFSERTVGEYMYMMEKAENFANAYYPMPYADILQDVGVERKALIYAIARQESKFINPSVSTSYALGMMQFMPFLANDTAKKLKLKDFDQDDMFLPQVALKFANDHLDWLEKNIKNPIFIAYAYNGGLGFTKRMILRGDLFNKGEFEPFLSMELVPFAESRLYGKRVLANYLIYLRALGSNTLIWKFFENSTIPGLDENFRATQ